MRLLFQHGKIDNRENNRHRTESMTAMMVGSGGEGGCVSSVCVPVRGKGKLIDQVGT